VLKSLKGNIIIPVIIALTLAAATVYIVVSAVTENLAHTLSQERILGITQSANAYLERLKTYVQTASSTMAASPVLLEFMQTENREEMINYLDARGQALNVDSFVVTDSLGYVIIRTHDPDRYGDSATTTPCIAAAMRGEAATAYTTNPAVPMAMSSAMPIYDTENKLVGVVSSSFILSTDEFVDNFGQIFNAEVTVFRGYEVAASTVLSEDGSRTTGQPVASMRIAGIVIGQGEIYETIIALHEVEHHEHYFPLRDAADEVIGMFSLGFSNEQTLATMSDMRRALLIVGVVGLVGSAGIMFLIIARRLKPLEKLTKSVSQINDESMTVYGVGRTDEIGLLSRAIQNMLRDISLSREKELKHKIDEKEREVVELRQKFYDSSPAFIEIWDENYNLIDCNQKGAELFGLSSPKEFVERFAEFSPEYQPCGMSSTEKWVALADKAFKDGYVKFEWMHITADGEPFPVETTFVRLRTGEKTLLMGHNHDLRPLRAAMKREHELEMKLHEQKISERVQLMLDAAPILIDYWSKDFQIIDSNKYAMEFYGFSSKAEYLLADPLTLPETQSDGMPSVDSRNAFLDIIFRNGHGKFEFEEKQLNGDIVYLEVEGIRTKDVESDEDIVITYAKDVTQARENERIKEQALAKEREHEEKVREAMQESNRAKSRFLARMSHEIRTPITAVLGLSEIQLRNQTMPPQTEEAFSKIYDSSKMLLNIVNDILDFSKIESGKMPLFNNEYDVASLVSDAAQLHLIYAERKDILFKIHVDENLPAKLIGDALRIRQITTNLLTNAFKYTESGSVDLSLQGEKNREGYVTLVISIRDTGMGMTAQQIAELRGEYVRLHEQEKPFVSGTGLGIPIVYSLAKMMNAELDLQSEVGKGTNAVIRIPQEVSGIEILGRELADSLQKFETKSWSAAKELEFVPEQMPHGNVLVVDDVETNLHVAELMLESFALNIELCKSGQGAIDKVKQGKVYDIIFMDHMMPGIDGIEATKTIREMGYSHPIVAFTANALKGQAEMFKQNGFSGFISKPIDIKLLNSCLVRFIKNKED